MVRLGGLTTTLYLRLRRQTANINTEALGKNSWGNIHQNDLARSGLAAPPMGDPYRRYQITKTNTSRKGAKCMYNVKPIEVDAGTRYAAASSVHRCNVGANFRLLNEGLLNPSAEEGKAPDAIK